MAFVNLCSHYALFLTSKEEVLRRWVERPVVAAVLKIMVSIDRCL